MILIILSLLTPIDGVRERLPFLLSRLLGRGIVIHYNRERYSCCGSDMRSLRKSSRKIPYAFERRKRNVSMLIRSDPRPGYQ